MTSRRPSHSSQNSDDYRLHLHLFQDHQFYHSVEEESGQAIAGVSTIRSRVQPSQDHSALKLLVDDDEFNEAEDFSQLEISTEDNDNVSYSDSTALRSVASRQTYNTFDNSNVLYKPRSRVTNYRRLSIAGGNLVNHPELLNQEIGLLKDNGFEVDNSNLRRTFSKQSSFASRFLPSVYTPIINQPAINQDIESVINLWDEAVENGEITSSKSWSELKVVFSNSFPLIITFLLQSLLGFNALLFIGKLGQFELLSAYTLGSMTGNITGLVIVQGLSTCLDTLCSQAYGAGKYHLVGTYFQRCTFLILLVFVPISFIWINYAESIIVLLISTESTAHNLSFGTANNKSLAYHAALYLKYLIPGIPGYILFETGKRFLQCQGVYVASTYTLICVVFINFFLNCWFIRPTSLGFIGAPIALSITFWIMPFGLLGYVLFASWKARKDLTIAPGMINPNDPLKCWPRLKFSALLKNWGIIFRLAIPGTIMCLAELLAFEILTFSSSHISTEALAAQSIIASVGSISFQIPFGVSIATSTRVANLIGAGLPASMCYKTVKISLFFGVFLAFLINFNILYFGRHIIPTFFTSDQSVVELTAKNLPLIAYISIFDEITAISSGVLRGMGMQKIGSWLNLGIYYIYGVPASFILTFTYGWGIAGLWAGVGSGLSVIGLIQCAIIYYGIDYDNLVEEARLRNEEEN